MKLNERVKEAGFSNASPTLGSVSLAPTVPMDNLLASIEYFCRHHMLPFSKERAMRGVPLRDGVLSPKTYDQACENVGLLTKAVKKKPSTVSEMVFPFLTYFKDGTVGVVRAKNTGGSFDTLAFDKSGNRIAVELKSSEIDRKSLHTVQYVTKLAEEDEDTRQKGHWFWATVRRFWPSWSYVVLATFLINLLGLALPLFVMNVYDRVIPNNSISTLWALALGVSIALGFDFLLKILRSAMIDNSGKRIDLGVSARIFEHALDVKMDQRHTRSGEMANHVREFESVREFFSSGAITSLVDLLFIGVFLGLLWFIVGPLVLVPLLAVPLVLFVTLLVQFPLTRSIRNAQSASGTRHSVLVESLIGVETVKSIVAESAMQKRWEDAVSVSARAGAHTRFWSSLAIYFTMFVQQAVSVLVIIWGVFLVGAGEITIGALIAANILAGRILAPLGGISSTLVRAQQSFASLANLNTLMKLDRDNPKSRG
ncbi:MAG: ABC transporter transmembrane domain-containing protein, partial [Pseudomonadota bacterium]